MFLIARNKLSENKKSTDSALKRLPHQSVFTMSHEYATESSFSIFVKQILWLNFLLKFGEGPRFKQREKMRMFIFVYMYML